MGDFYVDNDQPQTIMDAENDTTLFDSLPDVHDPVPRKLPEPDKEIRKMIKALEKLNSNIDILLAKIEDLKEILEEYELLDISEGLK